MNKNFPIAFLMCSFIMYACQSNKEKNNSAAVDSSVFVNTDTMLDISQDTNNVEDPDRTDSIPATMNGINTYDKQTENLIRVKLQDVYKDDLSKNIIDSSSRKFIFFQCDLDDDNTKEIFVGLIGSYFCGSGGCTILLFDNSGKLITRFTITDYPVVIAGSKTNGWKDLILMSRNKNHLMKFNGKNYPSNPSVQPEYNMTPSDEWPRALNFMNEPYPWFRF